MVFQSTGSVSPNFFKRYSPRSRKAWASLFLNLSWLLRAEEHCDSSCAISTQHDSFTFKTMRRHATRDSRDGAMLAQRM